MLNRWFVARWRYNLVIYQRDLRDKERGELQTALGILYTAKHQIQADLDHARAELANVTTALNAQAASDLKIIEGLHKELKASRDEIDLFRVCLNECRDLLAALQHKHNLLVQAVNDAAMLANEIPEAEQMMDTGRSIRFTLGEGEQQKSVTVPILEDPANGGIAEHQP